MCRFVLYLGPEITVSSLVTEPEHSIIHQSYMSREREEPLNGDGFGLAWYAPHLTTHPALFKDISPAWNNDNLREMAALTVPIIVTITGEGGSGGALAVAVGNRVQMMQYSVYAVISPEGCAAILWSDGTRGPEAAEALKLTSMDIDSLGTIIDDVIPEPVGGAHNNHVAAAATVKEYLKKHLAELQKLSPDELVEQRYQKFRAMTIIEE